MRRAATSSPARWLHAFLSAALLTALLFACNAEPLVPRAGLFEFMELSRVPVPGGHVNAAGGNYFHELTALELDTRLGPLAIGAVYNSGRGWTFSVDATYKNGTLRDASGASLPLATLAAGDTAPGTHWVKLDATRVKTKGGLLHEFDPTTGRLVAMHWARASYPRLRFVQAQLGTQWRTSAVVQCTSPTACSPVLTLGYDATARLTRVDDRAGRTALFSYDSAGKLSAARDGLDVAQGWPGERYAYAGALLASIVSSEGERIEIVCDPMGRATQVRAVGAGDPTWRFSHGLPSATGVYTIAATDPLGFVTSYAVDGSARLLSLTNALGERTTYTWSGLRPASQTLPDGATTRWTWASDDMASETLPSGNVRTFTYQVDAQNRDDALARPLLELRDALGLVERRAYDHYGWITWLENGANEIQRFANNPDGSLWLFTDADEAVYRFDDVGEHGWPRYVSHGISLSSVTELRYDAVGNALTMAMPTPYSGGVREYAYDHDRNLARILVSDQPRPPASTQLHAIDLAYRSDGRLSRVTRPYGGETLFVYDALGRAIERRERVSAGATSENTYRSTRFSYDALGRLTASELPNGMRLERGFDAAGRLASLASLRSGSVETDVRFAYQAGRLVAARSPDGSFDEALTWDAAGRLIETRHTLGESTHASWDVRSRMTGAAFTWTNGAPVAALAASYDLADRQLELSALGSTLVQQIFSDGRLQSVVHGNGIERRSQRVTRHMFESANDLLRGPTPLARGDNTVNAELAGGLQATSVVVKNSGALNATAAESFSYASIYTPAGPDRRLAAGVSPSGQPESFYYDALSNLIGIDAGVPRSIAYNAEHNRVLSTTLLGGALPPAWQHTHDEAGFELARTFSAQGSATTTTFTWNALGKLSAIVTGGAPDVVLSYDALGRRRSLVAEGAERRWRFGGVVEADALDAPVAIDLGVVRIALDGAHRYRHPDTRGNTQIVSNAAGQLVSLTRYGAYGESLTSGLPNRDFGFARGTHLATRAGEFVLLGSRVLDPRGGRFLSPDPVWNPINDTAYTFGNPVDFWDRSGLHPGHTGGISDHREIELAQVARDNAAQIAVAAVATAAATKSPAAIGAAVAAVANLMAKQRELDVREKFHEMEFPVEVDPGLAEPPMPEFDWPVGGIPTVTICDTPAVC